MIDRNHLSTHRTRFGYSDARASTLIWNINKTFQIVRLGAVKCTGQFTCNATLATNQHIWEASVLQSRFFLNNAMTFIQWLAIAFRDFLYDWLLVERLAHGSCPKCLYLAATITAAAAAAQKSVIYVAHSSNICTICLIRSSCSLSAQ